MSRAPAVSVLLSFAAACGDNVPTRTADPPSSSAPSLCGVTAPPYNPATVAISGAVSATLPAYAGLVPDEIPHPLFTLASAAPAGAQSFQSRFLIHAATTGSYGVPGATLSDGTSTWSVTDGGGTLTLDSVQPVCWGGESGWAVHGTLDATLQGQDGSLVAAHADF